MPRLFVAVWPPATVVDELAGLPRPVTAGTNWTKPERLHITLRFLGDCDTDEALATLGARSFPKATVTLGPAPEQLGRGVLMLPADGVDELGSAVIEATQFIGDPPPDRPFVGHMTVARFRKRRPTPDWPRLGETFACTEISLVESTPWGAYVDVTRFPLE